MTDTVPPSDTTAGTASGEAAVTPDGPKRGGWYFDRSRLRLGIVIGLICGAMAYLLMQGLDDATLYFRNADEAVELRDELGTKRFRLQGTVVPGSVEQVGTGVEFDVTYNDVAVHVRHEKDPPELFKADIPVVLDGHFLEGSDVFASESMAVKHTSEYRAENGERIEQAEEEAAG